ncbi:MAG: hypothetical protein ACI9BF_000441 [Candidatus Paceibacteria bacterium]|jgi:hypothetical protein
MKNSPSAHEQGEVLNEESVPVAETSRESGVELQTEISNLEAKLADESLNQMSISMLEAQIVAKRKELAESTAAEVEWGISDEEKTLAYLENQTRKSDAEPTVEPLSQEIAALEDGASVLVEPSLEPTKEVPTEENIESTNEKVNHFELKHSFMEARREYEDALKKEASVGRKLFGIGRDKMNEDTQKAYDKYMLTNEALYKSGRDSGVHDRLANILNIRKAKTESKTGRSPEGVEESVKLAVANRHILNPAEKRLELQTSHMPESISNLKDRVVGKIKQHPTIAIALGGTLIVTSAVFSLPALLTGIGTRYAGGKIGDRYEAGREKGKKSIVDSIGSEINLSELESEYFNRANKVQRVRTGTNWAAVGAGLAAGGINTFANAESIVDVAGSNFSPVSLTELQSDYEDIGFNDVQDVESGPAEGSNHNPHLDTQSDILSDVNESPVVHSVAAESIPSSQSVENNDGIFVPERGDNLSTALVETIKARVANGSLVLPPGVGNEGIAHYMYQSFPEMTDATDVSPRLTPDQWRELNVSSGDPNKIGIGEQINIDKLLDNMWGPPSEVSAPTTPDPFVVNEVVSDTPPVVSEVLSSESATGVGVVQPHQEITVGSDTPDPLPDEMSEDVEYREPSLVSNVALLAASQSEILSDRAAILATQGYEGMYGYSPMYVPELELRVFHAETDLTSREFSEIIYRQTLDAYQAGEINLPVETMNNVANDSTAINAFVDKNADEFSGFNPFLSDREPLGLSVAAWIELGFSSGNPDKLVAGDSINVGNLIKHIIEHAAERINGRLN